MFALSYLWGPGQQQTTGDPKIPHQNAVSGPSFGLQLARAEHLASKTKQIKQRNPFFLLIIYTIQTREWVSLVDVEAGRVDGVPEHDVGDSPEVHHKVVGGWAAAGPHCVVEERTRCRCLAVHDAPQPQPLAFVTLQMINKKMRTT